MDKFETHDIDTIKSIKHIDNILVDIITNNIDETHEDYLEFIHCRRTLNYLMKLTMDGLILPDVI